ncbi:MAG: helix-turn-helix transcriptional regulator [Bacilli bacterium]|nr:helix-turn-helix transcriptional regulator [Bacilli bacterium]
MKMQFYSLKDLLIFNIKYYRYKNNLSQEKLAELCSFSSRYMTDIERGKHCPTIDKIEVIARNLKLEPYELFQNPKRDEEIVSKIVKNRQYNQN